MLHSLNITDGGLFGGIQRDDCRSNNTIETTYLADKAEPFFQEDCRQYRSHDDGQGSHGSNEDRIDETVGDEIAGFANNHQSHAEPPPKILQVSIALAGLLIVFDVGLQQADLLDDERYTDEQSRGDGERDTDHFVYWRLR